MTPAVAIQALVPNSREVYRVHRAAPANWPAPGGRAVPLDPTCLRCGTPGGARRFRVVFTRDRGTSCANVQAHIIHDHCIPTAADVPRGIPARSFRASQVRA